MIVISGALVLVALILLIVGVVGPDLTFVYASIGVSLVSLVFLVIGILQRRGDSGAGAEAAPAPAPAAAEDPADDAVTTVLPSQVGTSRRVTEQPPIAETADEEPAADGDVLVVEGRPRYHVEGCRYLSGKQAEAVDVLEAREEGFTPCGVCKPDDALVARADDDEPELEDEEQDEEDVVEEDVPGVEVPVPTRTATRAVKAPAKKAAAKKAPAKVAAAAPARKPAAKAATKTVQAPTRAAAKAPSKAAAAAAAATPAAAGAAKKAGSVVVIPDRGKFHKAECRFVRDAAGAEVLTRTAAARQGYAACGVCKP